MRIGFTSVDYGLIRNVLSGGAGEYVKIWSWNALLCAVLNRINRVLKSCRLAHWLYPDIIFRYIGGVCFKSVDIIHLWNGISWTHKPWVVTYESMLPRSRETMAMLGCDKVNAKHMPVGIARMALDNCRAIIAISQNAYDRQKQFLDRFPEIRDLVLKKLYVLHPPQKVLCSSLDRFYHLSTIRFVFVGASFWRKGGEESFYVFRKLRNQGMPISLEIVSSLEFRDYATRSLSEVDKAELMRAFKDESDWCHFHSRMPNDLVLELMKNSHVLLLPTHADTYGYSVLEGQACGCPVISTDVRALPEINNDECGWMIKVPKNIWGEALYETPEQLEDLRNHIEEGLESIVKSIVKDPGCIAKKAQKALDRIRLFHDQTKHAAILRGLYEKSL